jgi:hypothetical protein
MCIPTYPTPTMDKSVNEETVERKEMSLKSLEAEARATKEPKMSD